MGRLTDEMTRLCGEIVSLRQARQSFVKGLHQGMAAMRADFRRAHREMARRTRFERTQALSHLRKTMAGMRQEFAADLEGARRAWAGK